MTDEKTLTRASKMFSLVLRHDPSAAGVRLDSEGWVELAALVAGVRRARRDLARLDERLAREVVATNAKQRFQLSDDGLRIRAVQGHSTQQVARTMEPAVPPEVLFHGTAQGSLASIRSLGLVPGTRHHVHLSAERATAVAVGSRHGRVVVLTVRAGDLHRSGHTFHLAENGVWLTDGVPVSHLDGLDR